MPYYLCKDGKINTDGSDLLDIRFNEEAPCVDYFEQCCETGEVLLPSQTTPIPHIPGGDSKIPGNTGGVVPPPGGNTGGVIPPPGGNTGGTTGHIPTPTQQKCGFRNSEGVGFRITGNNDNEAEYGEFPWMVAILKGKKLTQ